MGATKTVDEVRTRLDEINAEGHALVEEFADKTLDDATREKLRSYSTEKEELENELKTFEDDDNLRGQFRTRTVDGSKLRGPGRPIFGGGPNADEIEALFRSPGEAFSESDAYKAWTDRFPQGGPVGSGVNAQSDAVEMTGSYRAMLNMRTSTERWRAGVVTPDRYRALITSADASSGLFVRPEFRGLLEPGQTRPLTVRQLITVLPTASDAIEYIAENSRISAAAPVTEAVQLAHTGDVTATKPEGGLTFVLRQDVVKSIALWVPATNRILSDAPQLRAYIDQYLTDDIAIELEDQIVSGTGGAGFTGIFNTSGTQTLGPPGAQGIAELDLLRSAKRLVRTNARTDATAILANPSDTERWDLIKAGTNLNNYAWQGGVPQGDGISRIWGLPIIESEACPVGFALVGDFRRAVLFDRESVNISVGTANEDFIRNIVRILAEMRAGFGVLRPAAFVEVDLAP